MHLVTRVVVVVLLGFAGGSAGQEEFILRTDRVIDGRGNVLENRAVVVRDGAIATISAHDPATVYDYDLTGLTVLPGLIDTHVHIGWHFDADGRLHDDDDEPGEVSALYAAENAYATLMAGVTTVQSLGSPVDKHIRDAIARGSLPGPRILTSLRSVNVRTGSPDDIRTFVGAQKKGGADVIKIFGSASIRDGGEPRSNWMRHVEKRICSGCAPSSTRTAQSARAEASSPVVRP